MTRTDLEKARAKVKSSLALICQTFLGYKDWGKLHWQMQAHINRPSKFKLFLIPRDHLKSSVITKGGAILRMLQNPNIRILIANNTWDNSRKFLDSIRNYLTTSPGLKDIFGGFMTDRWNRDEIIIRQRTMILDAPTIATTGLEKEQTSQHYDLIIADDLVARENSATAEQRQKVKDYINSLMALLEPNGELWVVGTRWSQDDAYGDLIDEGIWDVMKRGAYADKERTIPVFPEKFTTEKLQFLRNKLRATLFSCWYMNDPIAPESTDFSESWVRYWEPGSKHPMNLYLMVDPAYSLGKDANYSAGTVSGKLPSGVIRVVDYFRKRVVPSELVDLIFDMVRKWRVSGHYVRVGVEAFTLKTLKADLQNRMRQESFYFTVDEIKKMRGPNGEKVDVKHARIRGMQPLFEQGLIELRSDMTDFIDELLAFPRGKTDDLIDSLSLAVEHLLPGSDSIPQKTIVSGSMAELLQRLDNRARGTVYEEFMKDLREVAA